MKGGNDYDLFIAKTSRSVMGGEGYHLTSQIRRGVHVATCIAINACF